MQYRMDIYIYIYIYWVAGGCVCVRERERERERGFEVILSKAVLIFPKNFFNFRSDTTEKQGIIDLCSKSYAFVGLNYSEVAFIAKMNDATFSSSFAYRLRYIIEVCRQIFLSSKLQGVFH